MKKFIREHNTNFRLNDARMLAMQWMAALDSSTAASYFDHVRQNEDIFKTADNFVEIEIEPKLDEDGDNSSLASLDSESEIN